MAGKFGFLVVRDKLRGGFHAKYCKGLALVDWIVSWSLLRKESFNLEPREKARVRL